MKRRQVRRLRRPSPRKCRDTTPPPLRKRRTRTQVRRWEPPQPSRAYKCGRSPSSPADAYQKERVGGGDASERPAHALAVAEDTNFPPKCNRGVCACGNDRDVVKLRAGKQRSHSSAACGGCGGGWVGCGDGGDEDGRVEARDGGVGEGGPETPFGSEANARDVQRRVFKVKVAGRA
jgi:hypothetical protein